MKVRQGFISRVLGIPGDSTATVTRVSRFRLPLGFKGVLVLCRVCLLEGSGFLYGLWFRFRVSCAVLHRLVHERVFILPHVQAS